MKTLLLSLFAVAVAVVVALYVVAPAVDSAVAAFNVVGGAL